jgi:small subunit ribosomal protein S4e
LAKKGGSKSLGRYAAPDFWQIKKKEYAWAVRPTPGPHKLTESFSLTYVIRDLLHLAKTGREVRYILNNKNVLVDGKVRTSPKFPVGLMDVISIPTIGKIYRVLPDSAHVMKLAEITSDSETKLCKIMNKTILKGGRIQINLHDGRSIFVDSDEYKVNDVVQISLKDQSIVSHVPFAKDKIAIVQAGVNNGRMGTIVDIKKIMKNDTVTLDDKGKRFDTKLQYAFVVGADSPLIELPM